jgi:hypothetical protein
MQAGGFDAPKAIAAVWAALARSEQNTAAIPSPVRRLPSAAASALPRSESRHGSQSVARSASLSSAVERVSKTIPIIALPVTWDITRPEIT